MAPIHNEGPAGLPDRKLLSGDARVQDRVLILHQSAMEKTMKRLHVHVSVDDLAHSIRFYSTLLPRTAVTKPDYAKWMLDDPRVNFAISTRSGQLASIISGFRSRRRTNCKSLRRCNS